MADRRAVNKYYPPEWEPKHGSINTFRGQHPLRERAKKLGEGILVVRFEMPYNVWCTGCDAHIGKGVRYNAEKKKAGKYFSTIIWSFRMKCHLCSSWMEVQTDPENRDYKMASGVTRKTETWKDSESISLPSIGEKVDLDPIARLEQQTADKRTAERQKPALQRLLELNEEKRDDFAISQTLRRQNRAKREQEKELKEESLSKGLHLFTLLPKSDADNAEAQSIQFPSRNKAELEMRDRRTTAKLLPILHSQTLESAKSRKSNTANAFRKARKSGMDLSKLRFHPEAQRSGVVATRKSAFPNVAIKKNSQIDTK